MHQYAIAAIKFRSNIQQNQRPTKRDTNFYSGCKKYKWWMLRFQLQQEATEIYMHIRNTKLSIIGMLWLDQCLMPEHEICLNCLSQTHKWHL